jgi:hypothetical protein
MRVHVRVLPLTRRTRALVLDLIVFLLTVLAVFMLMFGAWRVEQP